MDILRLFDRGKADSKTILIPSMMVLYLSTTTLKDSNSMYVRTYLLRIQICCRDEKISFVRHTYVEMKKGYKLAYLFPYFLTYLFIYLFIYLFPYFLLSKIRNRPDLGGLVMELNRNTKS